MFSAKKRVKQICYLDQSLLHNPEVKEIIECWQKDHNEIQRQLDARVINFGAKEKIQIILDALLKMHEDKKLLQEIMMEGGLQHENISQGAIAGIMRILMKDRDKKNACHKYL